MMKANAVPVIEIWRMCSIIVVIVIIMIIAAQIDCRNAYARGWSRGFGIGLNAVPVMDDPKPKRRKPRDAGA